MLRSRPFRPVARALPLGASIALHAAFTALVLLVAHRGWRPPAPLPPPAALVGETFEIPIETAPAPATTPAPAPAPAPTPAPAPAPAPARARTAAPLATTATPPAPARASASAAVAPPAPASTLYGAVGVRSAVDLSATFSRLFPQTCYALPEWKSLPIGPAGDADVVLSIDPDGHLQGRFDVGGVPSPVLRRSLDNMYYAMKARLFTARGARTAFRVSAAITSADVTAFALADGPVVGDVRSYFIDLPPGRRVELKVKPLP